MSIIQVVPSVEDQKIIDELSAAAAKKLMAADVKTQMMQSAKNRLLEGLKNNVEWHDVVLENQTVSMRRISIKEMRLAKGSDSDTLQMILESVVKEKLDFNNMSISDFENLLFNMRKLSKPEFKKTVICDCGTEIQLDVNMNQVIFQNEGISNFIELDNMSLTIRRPMFKELEFFDINDDVQAFNLAIRCIDKICLDGETMQVGVDIDFDELNEIIEYLNPEIIKRIVSFIADSPKMVLALPVVCTCGASEAVVWIGDEIFEQ